MIESPLTSRGLKRIAALVLLPLTCLFAEGAEEPKGEKAEAEPRKPNIIYVMLDEWGYYESGHMGHPDLLTPNIDEFATEGVRFTDALAGAPVCGPTRAVLLTGLHTGHTSMRINSGSAAIREEEPTLASMLKTVGYATGGFGKWGIGARGTSGVPETHGFDVFYGFYDQVHAHTFYPQYLIRNGEEVVLPGNPGETYYDGETHAQNAIFDASIEFVKENKDQPFFLYLPWTPPHGLWGIDEDDPSWILFKDKPWMAGQQKNADARVYAAFLHKVDHQFGQVLDLLDELGIADDTLIMISGDNGGSPYFKTKSLPKGFFSPNVDPKTGKMFREGKRWLYEGGLKVPFLARWPGKIAAGSVDDHPFYFPDMMPTFAEIAGAECPETDGLSILPTLLKEGEQAKHPFMYWEYEGQTAVRMDQWKAFKGEKETSEWELYDLSVDPSESNSVAADHPEILAKMIQHAKDSSIPVNPGVIYDQALVDKDRAQAPDKKLIKKEKIDRS